MVGPCWVVVWVPQGVVWVWLGGGLGAVGRWWGWGRSDLESWREFLDAGGSVVGAFPQGDETCAGDHLDRPQVASGQFGAGQFASGCGDAFVAVGYHRAEDWAASGQ